MKKRWTGAVWLLQLWMALSSQSGTAMGIVWQDGRPKLKPIEVSALPKSVLTYVKGHFSGAEVKRAEQDEAGNYHVGIFYKNEPKGLLFSNKGEFKQLMERPQGPPPSPPGGGPDGGLRPPGMPGMAAVAIKDLPKSVTTYVSNQYKGASIERADKAPDGNLIVVVLSNKQPKHLLFDTKGNFKEELRHHERPNERPAGPPRE